MTSAIQGVSVAKNRPAQARGRSHLAIVWLAGQLARYVLIVGGAVILLGGCSQQDGPQELQMCLVAAEKKLNIYGVTADAYPDRCGCVEKKRGGKLPATQQEWEQTGMGSANLELVECAKADITSSAEARNLKNVAPLLQKRGFTDRQIAAYAPCAARAHYEAMRSIVASAEGKLSELALENFAQARRACENLGE